MRRQTISFDFHYSLASVKPEALSKWVSRSSKLFSERCPKFKSVRILYATLALRLNLQTLSLICVRGRKGDFEAGSV